MHLEPLSVSKLTIVLSPVLVWIPIPLLQSNGFIIHLFAPKLRLNWGLFRLSFNTFKYCLIAVMGDI